MKDLYMRNKEDKDTRYFVDLDLNTRSILNWDCGQRQLLAGQELANPSHHRIYLTRGQYNKLEKKYSEVCNNTI